ncbi:pimeloyl-ACP methyl ester carboxylesterase [Hasllibacter halocynthiae]|uniref:Pimeloyl-ACP methyl ester carboxylesterase n=1 Tax=Hasllibacter halocynthiae TaxID=595589 RepID=A0A2T0X8B8_9RHOB|nr:alpha/beta hydrolase [Hasllibacter halocynthiae]PRY95167.1 pimeloyl-ACP methyl ester carboxylesterase [Hasllibacter halocynthiae]
MTTSTDPLDAPPLERREGIVQGRPATWWVAGPGDGAPVLLLHGSGVDEGRMTWGPVAAILAGEGLRVVSPDLPGYGGTQGFGRAAGVADMTHWVRDFREVAGLGPSVVAGLSMGGGIALELALSQPDAVRHLVPVASYGISRRTPHMRLRRLIAGRLGRRGPAYALIARSAFVARGLIRRVTASRGPVDPGLVAALQAAARRQVATPALAGFVSREVGPGGFRTNLTSRLDEIAAPVTFVHGTRDPLIPVADARRAARPPRRLLELDCGHLPPREAPGPVARVLLDAARAGVQTLRTA